MARIRPIIASLAGLLALGIVALAAEADARSSSRSGGYSRPSSSYSAPSRRPSIAPAPSRPSSSGGYTRPSAPSTAPSTRPQWAPVERSRTPPAAPRPGAGDREVQRRTSADALQEYRRQQDRQRQEESRFARPSTPVERAPPVATGPWRAPPRYERYDDWSRARTTTYGGYGWSAPSYSYQSRPSFGMWDGMMLWFLLDNLRRPGYADFFHHHRDDPGYQSWRGEADRLARDNPDLRGKLDSLDGELTRRTGQPRDRSYVPPGIDPAIAVSAERAVRPVRAESSGGGFWIVVFVVLAGGAVLFWLWRRRRAAQAAATVAAQAAEVDMGRFRVGMTVSIDPTPFLMADGKLRVAQPAASAQGLASIDAVAALESDRLSLHRLYFPGGKAFYQVHLDAQGEVDECRYFAKLDEVQPANAGEWGFWLDEREGMIGWPEFETKDGLQHVRAWSPGEARLPPVRLAETIRHLEGTSTRQHDAMLYARDTGLAAPAPATEYLLVAAIEGDAGARVELHVGIDINPASLALT
jgi:hypothetical protein